MRPGTGLAYCGDATFERAVFCELNGHHVPFACAHVTSLSTRVQIRDLAVHRRIDKRPRTVQELS